jgi:DNA-binding NarL/FixJ family response regulator
LHDQAEQNAMTMTIASARLHRRSKIFIVDDHPLMCEGLRVRLQTEPDLLVCGEAADGPEALALLETTAADLVIIDLTLKTSHGLDLIKQIKCRHSGMRTLVLTAYDESLYAERALRAGALGYVNKQEVHETIVQAIRTVLEGRLYLSPTMTQRLMASAVGREDRLLTDDPVACLSNRELQVFRLIGQGHSTGVIAKQLQVSVHTIESYRENIRHKLQLANGSALMRRAVQWVLENG